MGRHSIPFCPQCRMHPLRVLPTRQVSFIVIGVYHPVSSQMYFEKPAFDKRTVSLELAFIPSIAPEGQLVVGKRGRKSRCEAHSSLAERLSLHCAGRFVCLMWSSLTMKKIFVEVTGPPQFSQEVPLMLTVETQPRPGFAAGIFGVPCNKALGRYPGCPACQSSGPGRARSVLPGIAETHI
eukprot:2868832-Amphidinium_carterae.4